MITVPRVLYAPSWHTGPVSFCEVSLGGADSAACDEFACRRGGNFLLENQGKNLLLASAAFILEGLASVPMPTFPLIC